MALQQFVAFVVVLLGLVSSQEVLQATQDTFDDLRAKHDRMLVEFYVPGCEPCEALAPEYDQAAKEIEEQGLKTKLVKIDASSQRDWVKNVFDIQAFPTLKYFKSGKLSIGEYRSVKIKETADTLVSYVRKRELGLWVKIDESDAEDFISMAQADEFVVVARVKKGSVRDKSYRAALDSLFSYTGATMHYALVHLGDKADPKEDSSLTMRRPGFEEMREDNDITMSGPWSDKNVLTWILDMTYPIVANSFNNVSYSTDALKQFRSYGLDWDAFVIAIVDEGEFLKVRSVIRNVAPNFPKFRFAVAKKSDLSQSVADVYAEDGQDCLTVLTEKKQYRLFHSAKNDLGNEKKVSKFLEKVQRNKAKPFYKSSTPPENPLGEDNVMTLTGNTFKEVVFNSARDVAVMFYRPEDPKCKIAQPIWSKIGKMAKRRGWSAKGFVMAKIDLSANEVPEVTVTKYPKIVFYPAVSEEDKIEDSETFDGELDEEEIVEFFGEYAESLDGLNLKVRTKTQEPFFSVLDRDRERKKKSQDGYGNSEL